MSLQSLPKTTEESEYDSLNFYSKNHMSQNIQSVRLREKLEEVLSQTFDPEVKICKVNKRRMAGKLREGQVENRGSIKDVVFKEFKSLN
jgi:hypothetical protein